MVTSKPVRIRTAQPGDVAGVREMLRQASLPIGGLEDQFEAGFVVVEAQRRLVGAAGVETHGRYGLLRSVVVDPRLHGQGAGKALVMDRLAWAARQGLEAVYLLTTTADAYFGRFGFEALDRAAAPDEIRASSEFALACPASALLMKLALGAGPKH